VAGVANKVWQEIACPHNWSGDGGRKEETAEQISRQAISSAAHDSAINISERVYKVVVQVVKGNIRPNQNVEMRRLINNPDAGKEPLEILEDEVPRI